MAAHRPPSRRPSRPQGMTLVEVLVALAIMAVLAALGWRGVDGMVRTKEISQAAAERTLRLATVMSQWEQDLQSVFDTGTVPPLAFDGSTLRLTRRAGAGVQMVAWAVNDGVWRRWASPAVTRQGDLQEAWLRSQQLIGTEEGQVRLLEGATGWQMYFFQGNSWSNAQSSGNLASPAAPSTPPPAPPSGASAPQAAPRAALPGGVRMVLDLPGGALTRDVALGPQS